MKKLILILSFLCFIANLNAQRRIRIIDLKIVIDKKASGDTIFSPGKIFGKAYIINLGPDSIKAGDRFQCEWIVGGGIKPATYPFVYRDYAKGDTFSFQDSSFSNGKITVMSHLCARAKLIIPVNGDSVPEEVFMFASNNESCKSMMHIYTGPTNIEHNTVQKLKLYPIPSEKFIKIEGESITDIIIYDMAGRLVKQINNVVKGDVIKIETENWSMGTYFSQIITTDNQKVVIKFFVAN